MVGRAFGWCILILTLSVSYEVFVRYVLNAPTVWSMDMMIQMYGALFLMAGPYALAKMRTFVVISYIDYCSQEHKQRSTLFSMFCSSFQECSRFWFGAEIAADSWRYKEVVGTAPHGSRFTFSKH